MHSRWLVVLTVGMLAVAVAAQAGTYQIDPVHSTVGFSVRHLGLSEVHGMFTNFTGTVDFDAAKPADFKAQGTIQVASVDTRVEARDKHLRSPDFFDVAKFPEIKFEAVSASKDGDTWVVKGHFTLHGTTKDIELRGTVDGPVKDPWGKSRIGLAASTTINRQDYGVVWSQKMDAGGVVLGDTVKIELQVEAVAQ